MSTVYTPTPTIMPASITLPQDLVDQRTAASVNVPFASLADAIAYLMQTATVRRARGCTSDLIMGNGNTAKTQAMVGIAMAETLSASNAVLYGDHLRYAVVDAAAARGLHVYFPLNSILIDGATITSAKIWVQPNTAHASLPAMMPAMAIVRLRVETGAEVGIVTAGMTDDASPDVATYNTVHAITITPDNANAVVDLSDATGYQYYMVFCNEGHTNAVAELKLFGISVTMTAARYQT